MASVLLPLAKGFEEVEAVALIDVMRRGGIEVRVAFIEDELSHGRVVVGGNGIGVQADTSLKNVISADFDMMVLPGGWGGTHALAQNDRVKELLREFKSSKLVGAICAAPLALHTADVLNEEFTCYPSIENQIRIEGYRHDQSTIIDGKVMTSQGVGTAIDFALNIVRELQGESSFKDLKESILA